MQIILFILSLGAVLLVISLVLGLIMQTVEALANIRLLHLIAAMVMGGIGFALGNLASGGWSIFGAILGGLVGLAAASQ